MKFEILGNKDTRSGFGDGLTQLGKTNPNVVALCADLTGSLKMNDFKDHFPDRFFLFLFFVMMRRCLLKPDFAINRF